MQEYDWHLTFPDSLISSVDYVGKFTSLELVLMASGPQVNDCSLDIPSVYGSDSDDFAFLGLSQKTLW